MASCSCGGCASCSHTIGCISCTADGFICPSSSLMPCTTLGWGCTSLAFFCSTWSHILLCVLSDEQTPTDPILPAVEQHKRQGQERNYLCRKEGMSDTPFLNRLTACAARASIA